MSTGADAIAAIGRAYGECLKDKCAKHGCELGLRGTESATIFILCCDKYRQIHAHAGKICDYIIFYSDGALNIFAVEMKSGRVDLPKAIAQIADGATVAERISEQHSVLRFFPVLLHGRRLHANDVRVLRNSKVAFRGMSRLAIVKQCGESLSLILEKYRDAYTLT